MADISALGDLKPSEPLDLDTYAAPSTFRFPKKGRYTVVAPSEFPATAFGKTKADNLTAQIDPTIVGPTNEGFRLRFTRISHKSFERGGERVSQFGDYLKACGRTGVVPEDPQAAADLIETTVNTVYTVDTDWRARNTALGVDVKGMMNFPKDEKTGEPIPYIELENVKDAQGRNQRVWANLEIVRFLPATS